MRKKIFLILLLPFILFLFISISHRLIYRNPDYVCYHMSRDLEDFLEGTGLNVKIIRGYSLSKDECHVWIKVDGIDIDSVWLLPLPNSQIFSNSMQEFDDYSIYEYYYG